MWTRKFWLDATERAVKTFAQALLVLLGAGMVNVLAVGWETDLGLAGGAALLSVLTSVASAQASTGRSDSASLVANVASTPTPALVAPPEGKS